MRKSSLFPPDSNYCEFKICRAAILAFLKGTLASCFHGTGIIVNSKFVGLLFLHFWKVHWHPVFMGLALLWIQNL